MYYGPMSYYCLGQVYPRRRLREPFPFNLRHHPLAQALIARLLVFGPAKALVGSTYVPGPRVGVTCTGDLIV